MGYGGKVVEQRRARDLRARGWTYGEICDELGVSKSSVSLWCRDIEVDEALLEGRRRARYLAGNLSVNKRPSRLQLAKLEEIERCRAEARSSFGELAERDLFVAGIALYAGEGFKTGTEVGMANCEPRLLLLFLTWFRRFFDVDESRLRVRLYLHEGLDLSAATTYWSELLRIPPSQFNRPYRAADDATRRRSKHPMGCPSVRYCSARHQRLVLGLVEALLSSTVSGPG